MQGWDMEGTLKRKGDSWVFREEGQTFKQKVTAGVRRDAALLLCGAPGNAGADQG